MNPKPEKPGGLIYAERLSSFRTELVFIGLALLFLTIFSLRIRSGYADAWTVLLFCFFCIFLFYALNYRTLAILISQDQLILNFGAFTWNVPLENIDSFREDQVPAIKKFGGAGIHFMSVGGRYRASFNFLEYPRLVITLKRKTGPVEEISFSTRQPEVLMNSLTNALRNTR